MQQTIIVYTDDATHARQVLAPLVVDRPSTHWVLVACAPRMTHRIGKWVTHSARESWRTKWAGKLFEELKPWLSKTGAQVSTVLATEQLPIVLARLQAEHGTDTRIVDARRPKLEEVRQAPAPGPEPESAPTPAPAPIVTRKPGRRWSTPGSLTGLGLLFLFAD